MGLAIGPTLYPWVVSMAWSVATPWEYRPDIGQRDKERCESGRIGLTANELTWETGSEGSNPSLSAGIAALPVVHEWAAPTGGPAGPPSRRSRPGSRECWRETGTGCRPWAVRRTRSTPTSWSACCVADGYEPAAAPERRRPGGGQHLRLHRGGPPGVDRHHSRAGRGAAGPAPGWWSPAAWPSATATSWPRPCPRSTWWPVSAVTAPPAGGSPARSGAGDARAHAAGPPAGDARFDLLDLPRPAAGALGLCEGGRGLRPAVRLLRHPVVPGPAAVPDPRRCPGRGGRAGRDGSVRARSSSSPRTWPRTGSTAVGRSRRLAGRRRLVAHRRR